MEYYDITEEDSNFFSEYKVSLDSNGETLNKEQLAMLDNNVNSSYLQKDDEMLRKRTLPMLFFLN